MNRAYGKLQQSTSIWLTTGLLLAGAVAFSAIPSRLDSAPGPITASRPPVGFQAIEDIRVGDRVIANMPPEAEQAEQRWLAKRTGEPHGHLVAAANESIATGVDPATWKLVRMRAERIWPDGTLDDINVETLQPPEWLAAHGVAVGKLAPIPLDLVEMGLPEDLMARVLAIERCPDIKDGSGRVVLTTVNHLNAAVIELTVEDERGERHRVRPTETHKFCSASRKAWLSAGDLQPGEQVQGLSGLVTVISSHGVPGTHRVYNVTVEGEHVFHVGAVGALVHNNGCRGAAPDGRTPTPIAHEHGFYEVEGMRISEYYYERLWREGRPAPFIVAREILESGVQGVPDAIRPGFFRYEFGGWELVYNPQTQEIWHLQPL